jgi:hypothetical protein
VVRQRPLTGRGEATLEIGMEAFRTIYDQLTPPNNERGNRWSEVSNRLRWIEMNRRRRERLFRGADEVKTSARFTYSGSARRTQEVLQVGFDRWPGEAGGGTLLLRVEVTDEVTGQEVERSVSFRIGEGGSTPPRRFNRRVPRFQLRSAREPAGERRGRAVDRSQGGRDDGEERRRAAPRSWTGDRGSRERRTHVVRVLQVERRPRAPQVVAGDRSVRAQPPSSAARSVPAIQTRRMCGLSEAPESLLPQTIVRHRIKTRYRYNRT